MLSQIFKTLKGILNAIEINVQVIPSSETRLEVVAELEAQDWIYSLRYEFWFHVSEVEVCETTHSGIDVALHLPTGLVLFANDCEYADGYVSDWTPESVVASFPGFGSYNRNDGLRYEGGH